MSLTASLGLAANSRSVFDIFVHPANRKTEMVAFRKAAMTCGMLPVRACEASSSKTTSRTQWSLFSMVQWPPPEFEQVFSGSLLGSQTCDAILRLVCDFCRLDMPSLDSIFVNLCESGPVGIGHQQSAGSQGSGGNKPVCCFNIGVCVKMGFCHGCGGFQTAGHLLPGGLSPRGV